MPEEIATDDRAVPAALAAKLAALGIASVTYVHPPLHTVAESQRLRGVIPGGHTKNLFLRDKKGTIFLVTADEGAAVDLKTLHQRLGASGRFSFGKPELLLEVLGVTPGSVTALALMNDTGGRVTAVLDASLLGHATVNCHPLTNTATTALAPQDLLRFMEATGHGPVILDFPRGEAPASGEDL